MRRFAVGGLWTREATEADLPTLVAFFDMLLHADYFFRRGHVADLVRQPSVRVHLVLDGYVLVAVAVKNSRNSTLLNLLVHPAYRGLGIGEALLGRVGAEFVRVKTDMSTGNPARFYRKLGYVLEKRGRRISVYRRGQTTAPA